MQKCHLELLDVLRAEIADLYRLRVEDDARLRRLERLAWDSAHPGPGRRHEDRPSPDSAKLRRAIEGLPKRT